MASLYRADGSPKEAWVKREIKKILDKYEALHYWMPPASEFGVSGQHDFMVCQCGMFWSIEAKAGYNKPSDSQIRFALEIKKAGGFSMCINEKNLQELDDMAQFMENTASSLGWGTSETTLGHDFTQWRKKTK